MLVNYLSDTLPACRSLRRPFCLACGAAQSPGNYLLWPRRCPACGRGRGLRTWLVELAAIAFTVWLWQNPPGYLNFPVLVVLSIYFGVIVVIDMEHRLILHPVSLAGLALGLGIGTWMHGLKDALLGGVAGFAIMLFFYYFGIFLVRLMARIRGEEVEDPEALGFGDVNLSGILGLVLGWPGILMGLGLAICLGGAVSLLYLLAMLLLRRYRWNMAIPYGPFLIASAVILLFFPKLLDFVL